MSSILNQSIYNNEPLPDYGVLYKIEEFALLVVNEEIFEDYGVAYYSDGNLLYYKEVDLKDLSNMDKSFSHVVWFDK